MSVFTRPSIGVSRWSAVCVSSPRPLRLFVAVMFRWTLQSTKSEVVPPGQRERTGYSLQTFWPVLCRARQGMERCSELAQEILGRTIVENGTKCCSRMQTQVTGCSGVQLGQSATLRQGPRSTLRQDRKRATGWKGKAGVGSSMKRARSSCVSARGLRFKGHSSLGHAVSSKGQDFCPALWHSSQYLHVFLSQTPYGYIQPEYQALSFSGRLSQALLVLSSDRPLLATVLTVFCRSVSLPRKAPGARYRGSMPSPDSGLRVPLHGSGRRSNEAGRVSSFTGTSSRFLIIGTCRSNGPRHGTQRLPDFAGHDDSFGGTPNLISHNPPVEFTAPVRSSRFGARPPATMTKWFISGPLPKQSQE
ncbi:hypothetical protein CSAL01_06148 [Colletotrichum salicis]|uniref:Uncharacterized protein n=1 Tax=Colletotrichum salicis TaxID=1209931 RepID=A0A135V2J5_9PEZI|nr:hypothetical protein CSAL01_06148 [Colletotrichum salicis]